jgi:hypothetical protein
MSSSDERILQSCQMKIPSVHLSKQLDYTLDHYEKSSIHILTRCVEATQHCLLSLVFIEVMFRLKEGINRTTDYKVWNETGYQTNSRLLSFTNTTQSYHDCCHLAAEKVCWIQLDPDKLPLKILGKSHKSLFVVFLQEFVFHHRAFLSTKRT